MGNILYFIPDDFADFEGVLALHILKEIGKRNVITVGCARDPVTGQSGVHYAADITLAEAAKLPDIEAFILPGGPLRKPNEALSALLNALHGQGKLLAAICFAPQYLAHAGLLANHRYTTSCTPATIHRKGIPDPFPRGNFVGDRVVKDRNIITAQGRAFIDFAFVVAEYLGLYETHEVDLRLLQKAIMDR